MNCVGGGPVDSFMSHGDNLLFCPRSGLRVVKVKEESFVSSSLDGIMHLVTIVTMKSVSLA